MRMLERLSGGWGILIDDLVAGVYATVFSHLLIRFVGRPYSDTSVEHDLYADVGVKPTSIRGEDRPSRGAALRDAGHYRVEEPEEADVAIMNTCTVVGSGRTVAGPFLTNHASRLRILPDRRAIDCHTRRRHRLPS